jgi:hypothetical protein
MSAPIPHSRRARLVQLSLAALATAAIAACGGGGGVGAGGTGITSGTVNGFGSVIVGGVRYDDSSASISREDASDDSKLRLGMSVDVSVDDSCGLTATSCVAHGFEIRSDLAGEVSAATLDAQGNGTITVMGQDVAVTANTFLHRSSGLSSSLGLGLGQIVKVHGRRAAAAATTDWVATYIEIKAASDAGLGTLNSSFQFRLAGTLTGTTGNYQIGGEPMDLAGLTVPTGTNPFVRVRITPAADRPASGWVVAEIKSQRNRALEQRGRSRVEVQGYVESATIGATSTVLVINGVDVIIASTGVEFDDGATYAGLATTTSVVEVKGSINDAGQLVATKVELSDEAEREFHVRPSEVSAVTATTFTVTKANTDPLVVEFDAGDFDRAAAGDIGTSILEIKGEIERTTGRLIVTRIKRDN